MQLLLSALFNGLIHASLLLLSALGLSLIFGLGRVANFAHGAFYAVGGYVFLTALQRIGVGFWPALALTPAVAFVVAIVLERLVIAPVRPRDEIYTLLATFGLSLVIVGFIEFSAGTGTVIVRPPQWLAATVDVAGVPLPVYRLFAAIISIAVSALVFALVQFTPSGLRIRAITSDQTMAAALGIPVARTAALVFAGATAMVAFAGALGAPIYAVHPEMGTAVLLDSFLVVVIGGLGYLPGAVAGVLIVALVKSLGAVSFPEWSTALLFLLVALVLVWRPTGVFLRGRAG